MSKQKGFTHIVVLVITIVIAVALVAVAWWYKTEKGKTNTNQVVVNTNVIINTNDINQNANSNTVTDKTANWKTYTNDKYEYSVKYPNDWRLAQDYMKAFVEISSNSKVKTVAEDYVVITRLSITEEADFINYAKNNKGIAIRPWYDFGLGKSVIITPTSATLEDYKKEIPKGTDVITVIPSNIREETLTTGYKITRLRIYQSNDNGEFVYEVALFPVINKNYNFVDIRVAVDNGNYEKEVFENMLSTFQFTDETADWKTYTNEIAGYSLKYPSNWSYDNTSKGNPAMFFDERASSIVQTELMVGTKVEIYYENSQTTSLKEAIKSKDTESSILSETDITLDDIPAVKRSVTGPFLNYYNVVYFIFKNKFFGIVQYIPEDAKKDSYTAIYNQILSTFQFTDETAGWKTYTNTNYGYSIKYPESWIAKEQNTSTVGDFVSVLPPGWEEKSTLETGPGVVIYKYNEVVSGDLVTNSHRQVINGVTATRQNENGLVGSSVTYFPYGEEYIRFGWQSPNESNYPEYEIILSSFTFTK